MTLYAKKFVAESLYATGKAPSDGPYVKTVNHIAPDEAGDVNLDVLEPLDSGDYTFTTLEEMQAQIELLTKKYLLQGTFTFTLNGTFDTKTFNLFFPNLEGTPFIRLNLNNAKFNNCNITINFGTAELEIGGLKTQNRTQPFQTNNTFRIGSDDNADVSFTMCDFGGNTSILLPEGAQVIFDERTSFANLVGGKGGNAPIEMDRGSTVNLDVLYDRYPVDKGVFRYSPLIKNTGGTLVLAEVPKANISLAVPGGNDQYLVQNVAGLVIAKEGVSSLSAGITGIGATDSVIDVQNVSNGYTNLGVFTDSTIKHVMDTVPKRGLSVNIDGTTITKNAAGQIQSMAPLPQILDITVDCATIAELATQLETLPDTVMNNYTFHLTNADVFTDSSVDINIGGVNRGGLGSIKIICDNVALCGNITINAQVPVYIDGLSCYCVGTSDSKIMKISPIGADSETSLGLSYTQQITLLNQINDTPAHAIVAGSKSWFNAKIYGLYTKVYVEFKEVENVPATSAVSTTALQIFGATVNIKQISNMHNKAESVGWMTVAQGGLCKVFNMNSWSRGVHYCNRYMYTDGLISWGMPEQGLQQITCTLPPNTPIN